MVAAKTELDRLKDQLERLWIPHIPHIAPTISFSNTFKRGEIELLENCRRVVANTSYCVAVVEPTLSLKEVSRVSFKINKSSNLYIGVCYRSIF